jgi:hypothetical protein
MNKKIYSIIKNFILLIILTFLAYGISLLVTSNENSKTSVHPTPPSDPMVTTVGGVAKGLSNDGFVAYLFSTPPSEEPELNADLVRLNNRTGLQPHKEATDDRRIDSKSTCISQRS